MLIVAAFAPPAQAEPMALLLFQTPQKLYKFDSTTPTSVSNVTITGLPMGETLGGIDVRPANGQLYSIGKSGRLYTINPTTGAATMGPLSTFTSTDFGGTQIGFDFDPVADRIRVTSHSGVTAENGRNARIDPATGAVTNDTALTYAAGDPHFGQSPSIGSAAYSNNVAGATTTTVYAVDAVGDPSNVSDPLVTVGSVGGSPQSADTGQLHTVGGTGVNSNLPDGFDVSPCGTAYYANTSVGGSEKLYGVNLSTGAANLTGTVPLASMEFASGLAVLTDPSTCPPPPPPSGGGAAATAETDPPETTIAKGPKKRTHKRKAKFVFKADETATFECKLDKRSFKPCRARATFKVKPKKHRLLVRAVDAAGNVDSSPARWKWLVLGPTR